jgi:hypothetical protein
MTGRRGSLQRQDGVVVVKYCLSGKYMEKDREIFEMLLSVSKMRRQTL